MRTRGRLTRGRLVIAAAGGALTALLLLSVQPFPTDVLGQTTPFRPQSTLLEPGGSVTLAGVTVVSQADLPVSVTVAGTTLTIPVPTGRSVQVTGAACTLLADAVTCRVTSGARVTFATAAVATGTSPAVPPPPGAPIARSSAVAGAAAPPRLQPAALPRTGVGPIPDRGCDAIDE